MGWVNDILESRTTYYIVCIVTIILGLLAVVGAVWSWWYGIGLGILMIVAGVLGVFGLFKSHRTVFLISVICFLVLVIVAALGIVLSIITFDFNIFGIIVSAIYCALFLVATYCGWRLYKTT